MFVDNKGIGTFTCPIFWCFIDVYKIIFPMQEHMLLEAVAYID
jgi:hypothetical protein